MTAAAATAGQPLPLLLDKLARHGNPGLERRHAVVLRALSTRLPHRSAEGKATCSQLADAASYTGRWVRETLAELEDLGVVEWHRGGVRQGKPQPSTFRVIKARLVELLAGGLADYAQLVAKRSAATAARVAGLTASFPRRRRSVHAEVRGNPTLLREVTAALGAAVAGPTLHPFTDDGTGTCRDCELPQANRRHRATATPSRRVFGPA
jgi:hypothetical protein